MLRFVKKSAIILLSVIILSALPGLVLAQTPHENPDAAKEIFSGISLLRYYSDALELLLKRDAAGTEAWLQKVPFAHVPPNLQEVISNFATHGINTSKLVLDIGKDPEVLKKLVSQYRFDEAMELSDKVFTEISQAYKSLEELEKAFETTAEETGAASASPKSELGRTYRRGSSKLDEIRKMLDLDKKLMANLLLGFKTTGSPEQLKFLRSTRITLKVNPIKAFVGDEIHFEGLLTSEGKPLPGRKVDILLNGVPVVTMVTGKGLCRCSGFLLDRYGKTTVEKGRFQGMLRIPYRYVSEMTLQALYYPRDKDIGLYLASRSPVVKLKVLFYSAELKLKPAGKSYPGLEAVIKGKFDYGQSPIPEARRIEVYLDNDFVTEAEVQQDFSLKLKLDPETELGRHVVTIAAPAKGRYAPVVRSAFLNVTQAIPAVNFNLPKVALIPGTISLGGRITSEVGPARNAKLKIKLGGSQAELVTLKDGTFKAKIKKGLGWEFIGREPLKFQLVPQEPWLASLSGSKDLFLINLVNSGGILAMLIFLSIWLPGRLRRRLRIPLRKEIRPIPQPQPSKKTLAPLPTPAEEVEFKGEPRSRILARYQWIVKLIQGFTRAVIGPQQTLREFLEETSPSLGPGARLFEALTRLVERLFYSSYNPTEEDVKTSENLAQDIKKGIAKEH